MRIGMWRVVPVLLAVLAGCADGPAGPADGTAMTASIDGAAWSAATLDASWQDQQLLVTGTSADGRRLRLQVPGVTTFALHKLGAGFPGSGELTVGAITWSATTERGTGHVHVTAISAAGATGTFAFTALEPQLGGAARAVTTGTFSVTF